MVITVTPAPCLNNSSAVGWAVVGYVPPLGLESKALHLVGGPENIFVKYQLMHCRDFWGELLCQVARSEDKPFPPQKWKEVPHDGATPEQKARLNPQLTCSFTDGGTGVQRAKSSF